MGKIALYSRGRVHSMPAWEKEFYERRKAKRDFCLTSRKRLAGHSGTLFEENEKLNETQYTQIAILACEAAILEQCGKQGLLRMSVRGSASENMVH